MTSDPKRYRLRFLAEARDDIDRILTGTRWSSYLEEVVARVCGELMEDPFEVGEGRADSTVRQHADGPLGFEFRVFPNQRQVEITRVYRTERAV